MSSEPNKPQSIDEAFRSWASRQPTEAMSDEIALRTWRAACAYQQAVDVKVIEEIKAKTHNRFIGGDQNACDEIKRRITGGK